MNRIFHARIAWYQYFLLVVLTVNAVGALWCKYILVAVLFMLMLIVVIEQIIHTTYTLTTNASTLPTYVNCTAHVCRLFVTHMWAINYRY